MMGLVLNDYYQSLRLSGDHVTLSSDISTILQIENNTTCLHFLELRHSSET